MSAVEPAASLFGSDDPDSDLFASLGADDSPQSVSNQAELSNDSTAYTSQPSFNHQDLANGSVAYSQSQAQWQSYEPKSYQPPTTEAQNTTPAVVYDPYAPATNYAIPANPPVQPAYNPYAPPPTTQSYAVPPLPPSTSQSAYGYPAAKPAATYASPYSVAPKTPYVAQTAAVVPPPPAPAPVLNRPKLSNAYDPPFLTTRSTRRGVSSARSTAYSSHPPAIPPPLPSGGQFTSSGYPLPPPPPLPQLPNSTSHDTVANSANWGYHDPRGNGTTALHSEYNILDVGLPPPSDHVPHGTVHQTSTDSHDTMAPIEAVDFESALGQSVARAPSPVKSIELRPSLRSNSLSTQTSDRSPDASFFSPPSPSTANVNRVSSPASSTTQLRTASPDHYAPPPSNGSLASGVFPPSSATDRVPSPASAHSLDRSSPSLSANSYLPNSTSLRERVPSPLRKSTTSTSFDPQKSTLATNGHHLEGAPSSVSSTPYSNSAHSTGQYLPPKQIPALPRNRSASSGSVYSSSSSPEHPYAPSQHGHGTQQRSESDYGSYVSRYNYSAPNEASPYDYPASQEIVVKPVHSTAYAPSPSLLGANDLLGRTSSRAPVFSFGFGGKFLTCFHGASINTGFDVALASRNSTGIHIRQLNKIIPQSALEVSSASFPGPLFSDPGTPTTGLVRTTASTQTKTKKTKLVKYLIDRAAEINQGIGYLHVGSVERRQAEGKLVLVKLLKILVENDGRLSGTPQIDTAVRAALVPKLDAPNGSSIDPPGTSPALGFSSIADIQRPLGDSPTISYPAIPTSDSNELPIATSILRPSALDKIQEFLVRGERRQAYHYALDERLWAHAMVIASSIDRDAWKETVNEFLRTELGANDNHIATPTNGREGLRVAYSLYSGQGSASVQELVPQNILSRATGRLQLPPAPHMTPMTPNFAAPAVANNIPTQSLAAWAETAVMMLSSPLNAETSAALTALGDQLLSHQCVEAAHACYLLSPQTSPVGGIGNPTARVVLLGSRSPQVWPSFYKDSDPVIFTEILEFALSLAPPAKGQDAFYGLPHLQAYRFIRAMALAELGELHLASRYCEAITASLSRGSPYFTPALLDQLKALSDRIVGLDHSDKSGFWKSTPSLDTIGRFLEGRFTKLVTGDTDPATPTEELSKPVDPKAGPFSQYSTISSVTSSTSPSPQPSLYNLNSQPIRSGSAMGQSGPPKSQAPIDRAASAMEHVRRRPSPPAPRIASANASTTTFAQAPSFGQAFNNYSPASPYSPSMATPKPNTETNDDAGQEVTWWGSSSYANDSANQTPVAATFVQVDAGASSSSDGFISLMDNTSYSVGPSAVKAKPQQLSIADEEDDDLGFGNSKREQKKEKEVEAPAVAAPERPEAKPAPAASSGSWLGRWWKRSETTPGPVKASLGEETSFYYDKELKRWVNKKAGADDAKPAAPPPPPPSRPQTASPGMTGPRSAGVVPPPTRSASAADFNGPPASKSVLRVRSNLVPMPESASLPNSPRIDDTPSTPPPGRPKSQASKRAIRSRYVDVFQQEGAGA
ncbi:Sec23-binding domain of Sec16-domain-containing protein [Mycena sp. CBHHK59/15]|nr:Sec23-binding domain of Sec16-domain-containing protein [Mycena sp. CBHHK59/15]